MSYNQTNEFDSFPLSSGSSSFPYMMLGAGNWTIPEGCTMVLFSQLASLPSNNPDGLISPDTRRVVQQFKNCMLLVLFLLGAPTNLINMLVFYKQGLTDRVALSLFCLAFTDGLYLTTVAGFQAEEIYKQFFSEDDVGRFFGFFINNKFLIFFSTFYVSPVLSALIAVERCLCIFNPLKFQTLMRTRTMAVVIFLVYVSVYSLAFVLFIRFQVDCLYDPLLRARIRVAVEGQFYKDNTDLINFMEGIVFGIGVIGGTMVAVTISTLLAIVKLRQIRQWRAESTSSSSISSKDVGLTRMLIVSSVVFIICVFPFALFNAMRLFFPEVDYGQSEHNLYVCCVLIGETFILVKPCFNIVVYYTMGSRYRETFWLIFGRKKPVLQKH